MIHTDDLNQEQAYTARLIADMEYKELPYDLTEKVMKNIAPSSDTSSSVSPGLASWWKRIISWLFTPRMITVPPFVPVSALAGVILLLTVLTGIIPVKQYTAPAADSLSETTEQSTVSSSQSGQSSQSAQSAQSGQQVINVVFTVHVDKAQEVALIGSFNNWQGESHKLTLSDQEGTWTIAVPLEKGLHEYAFVVDGARIIPDPFSLAYKDDGFGNLNSVIRVESNENT